MLELTVVLLSPLGRGAGVGVVVQHLKGGSWIEGSMRLLRGLERGHYLQVLLL